MSTVDMVTFKSNIEEIVLNADAALGDVYLVSRDRKYFLAHKIVLVSASPLFSMLLTVNCDHCGDITDDKVVLIFAGISGQVLKSFLALIYTGMSEDMSNVIELQHLCRQFNLYSVTPAPPSTLTRSLSGFKDVEPPECYTNLRSYMHSPAQMNNLDKYLDVSINEYNQPELKTEPVDYDENDFYEEPMDEDYSLDSSGVSSSRQVFKCHICYKEFKFKISWTSHLQHCHPEAKSTRSSRKVSKYEPEMEIEEEEEEEPEDDSDPDYSTPRKRRRRAPEIDFPYKEEKGRFFCLSGDCEANNQSFSSVSGLKEHYLEKHSTDDQKQFPCSKCGEQFGTNASRNKHSRKCGLDNETSSNSNSSTRKKRDTVAVKKESGEPKPQQPQLDMPMIEKNGYIYCMSGTCSETQDRCFARIMGLKEHFYDKHATDDQKHFPCEQCGYRFGTNGLKNRHIKKAHPDSVPRLSCPECPQEFDSNSALKNHMLEEHEGDDSDDKNSLNIPMKEENGFLYCLSGTCGQESLFFHNTSSLKEHFFDKHATDDQKHFPCENCGKLFGTKTLRSKHLKSEHNIGRTSRSFSCTECAETFNYHGNLKKHILKVHTPKENNTKNPKDTFPMKEENGRCYCLSGDCVKKNTSFSYLYGLREHYYDKHATDEEKTIPCNVCELKFGTKSLRNKHHKLLHPDEPVEKDGFFPYRKQKYECRVCRRAYFSTAKLEEHMKMNHSEEERPFICQECGKTFRSKGNLGEHMQLHMGILITCDVCGLTFKSESMFKKHYKIRHTHTFGCTLCDKRFGIESALKTHMRYHTGEKPYVCEACGKSYEIASALASHMGRHHKPGGREKKYPCDMCDKQFFEIFHLQRHKRFVHLKERNYHCEECGNSFRDSFALKNHMEKHEGISYPCEHCAEKFACQTYLKKHIRKRHRDLIPATK